jgi:hypothetical protein
MNYCQFLLRKAKDIGLDVGTIGVIAICITRVDDSRGAYLKDDFNLLAAVAEAILYVSDARGQDLVSNLSDVLGYFEDLSEQVDKKTLATTGRKELSGLAVRAQSILKVFVGLTKEEIDKFVVHDKTRKDLTVRNTLDLI